MTATLHVLRPDTLPISGFLRIGHTGHRKLAELQAQGEAETRSRAPAFRCGIRPAAAVMGGR